MAGTMDINMACRLSVGPLTWFSTTPPEQRKTGINVYCVICMLADVSSWRSKSIHIVCMDTFAEAY